MKESPPKARLTIQILQAFGAVEEELEAALEPIGLSLAKLNVLCKLADAGEPLPLGTLAERCACVRSNITQLVDRLEADRLVVRSDDAHDRRSVRAELTPQGRASQVAGLEALDRAEELLVARIPRQHRASFVEALQALHGES
jgi:MarR family transcriptional regulator, transcriptional regulator for hemolysin